jgi:hypothetical protein
VNSFHNAWIRSTPTSFSEQPQPTTEPLSPPAMTRHLVTVIDSTGSFGRSGAALPKQVQGSTLAGMPAPVAYAHDFGRESNDIHPSGEGHG